MLLTVFCGAAFGLEHCHPGGELPDRGQGGELTVSPGGMSPREALLAIREAKAKGNAGAWTVRVEHGAYFLAEPLVFTQADSGTPEAPVRWVGEDGKAAFVGGERVKGWRDEGNGVWSAPVPKDAEGNPVWFEQLWVNGRRAERARAPNAVPDDPAAGCMKLCEATESVVTNAADGSVAYIQRIASTNAAMAVVVTTCAEDLPYVSLCAIHKWNAARQSVLKVNPASMAVETSRKVKVGYNAAWSTKETLVWFENVRAAFYDVKAGRILYRPLPGEEIDSVRAIAPTAKSGVLVVLRGNPDKGDIVHDIVFKDISFAFTPYSEKHGARNMVSDEKIPNKFYTRQTIPECAGAVTALAARRVVWDGCRFRHTGAHAMRLIDGCVSNVVRNCSFGDVGAGGIWMGSENPHVAAGETLSRREIRTLAPRSVAFNTIENCLFKGIGRYVPSGIAVALTHASDCRIVHCDIKDCAYSGISAGLAWGYGGSVAQRNEIAFNRIGDIGKGLMSDMGGVYTLGTSFGTTIHDNVIHDVRSYSYGGWGIYFDEGSEGIVAERNLCWNTTDGGFMQHFGRGCIVRNNIFAWNRTGDAVRSLHVVRGKDGIEPSLEFKNNIVLASTCNLANAQATEVAGEWSSNLWYDVRGESAANIGGVGWKEWQALGFEKGGVFADPQFEAAADFDFRLKKSSPALGLGFKPWDFSNAGPKRGTGNGEQGRGCDLDVSRKVRKVHKVLLRER